MISKEIQIQKYQKIPKDTKYVRNPHILRTLPILPFFELFEHFWDFICLGCYLNRFVKIKRWSNDIRKNPNPKILKN